MGKLRILIISFAVIVLAAACNNSTKEETVQKTSTPAALEHKSEPAQPIPHISTEAYKNRSTDIYFNEFAIHITRFSTLENKKLPENIENDTLVIDADPGEYLTESTLIVSELTDVKVEQRYETVLEISHEDRVCDLSDWKHYTSEWTILKSETENTFICEKYTFKDFEKFPEIRLQELKEAIKEHCGDLIAKETKNIKSVDDYPAEVGVGRIYIRISGTQKSTGKAIVKYLIFDIPGGC
jgi:hypothetical protein